jgi:hypothetical protein
MRKFFEKFFIMSKGRYEWIKSGLNLEKFFYSFRPCINSALKKNFFFVENPTNVIRKKKSHNLCKYQCQESEIM